MGVLILNVLIILLIVYGTQGPKDQKNNISE